MRGSSFFNSLLIWMPFILRRYKATNFIRLLSMFIAIIFFFCSFFLSPVAHAESVRSTKAAAAQCLSLRPNHSSYQKAIDRIFALKSVQKWQKEMKVERKSSYIPDLDKTEIFNDECAWSIGIYQNKKDSLLLWKTFLLPIHSKQVYVYSVPEDSYEIYTDR